MMKSWTSKHLAWVLDGLHLAQRTELKIRSGCSCPAKPTLVVEEPTSITTAEQTAHGAARRAR